jgi:uncharacterized SAM-binding protein YcdF (DUF218 family)
MYELTKLLTALATPLSLAFLALLYAGFSTKRAPRLVCLTAAALLMFFGSARGVQLLLTSLENRYRTNTPASAPEAAAIVVLGGGLVNTNDPAGTTELSRGSERLWKAAELYHAQKAPLILVSGGNAPLCTHPPESKLAAGILQAWGIPTSAIITEEQSTDTRQNAVYSQRILAAKGITRILLVTSAAHMPRAAATFRRTGLTVFPVPADYLTGGEDEPVLLSLLPSAGAHFAGLSATSPSYISSRLPRYGVRGDVICPAGDPR